MTALPALNPHHGYIRDKCVICFVQPEWHLDEYIFDRFIRLLYSRHVIEICAVFITYILRGLESLVCSSSIYMHDGTESLLFFIEYA